MNRPGVERWIDRVGVERCIDQAGVERCIDQAGVVDQAGADTEWPSRLIASQAKAHKRFTLNYL